MGQMAVAAEQRQPQLCQFAAAVEQLCSAGAGQLHRGQTAVAAEHPRWLLCQFVVAAEQLRPAVTGQSHRRQMAVTADCKAGGQEVQSECCRYDTDELAQKHRHKSKVGIATDMLLRSMKSLVPGR